MKATIKHFKPGISISTITISHNSHFIAELKALCILLGGYNQYGRNIPLEKYQSLENRFREVLEETMELQ